MDFLSIQIAEDSLPMGSEDVLAVDCVQPENASQTGEHTDPAFYLGQCHSISCQASQPGIVLGSLRGNHAYSQKPNEEIVAGVSVWNKVFQTFHKPIDNRVEYDSVRVIRRALDDEYVEYSRQSDAFTRYRM